MDDMEVKRAYLCLVEKRAMVGMFSPAYAASMGAVPVVDVFGRIVAVTHAATEKADLSKVVEEGEEFVGLIDKDSVDRLSYAIALITPASTVYRGFVHLHTVPVSQPVAPSQNTVKPEQ